MTRSTRPSARWAIGSAFLSAWLGGGAFGAESAISPVGEAPPEQAPAPVSVLGDQGGIVSRAGQFIVEGSVEYAHADRNRVLFRGIEVVESVLVGVFDVNESRQDAVTGAVGVRFGVSSRLEVGARAPYVYRSDQSVLGPIPGSNNPSGSSAGDRTFSASGDGLGDVEASARFQVAGGTGGWPFLIANLQAVAPTGSDPFKVARDISGAPTEAATGAGFWGASGGLTAIMPTDPAVLFGSLSYTRNFGRDIGTTIGSAQLDYAKPGDSLSSSLGFGVSLNERMSFNLGYGHSWSFGTRTVTRVLRSAAPGLPQTLSDPIESRSRDLQVGRYLFGVSYRMSERSTLNWMVEVGATDDATDIRTSLRIPFTL